MSSISFSKPCIDFEIKQLAFSDPASLANGLEAYVGEQTANNSYDFLGNKTLLKLYLTSPDLLSIDIITQIFVLSLMRLPNTDYLALTYLVPAKFVSSQPKLKTISTLATLLETGKYVEFWNQYRANEDIVSNKYFPDAIRGFLLNTIRLTFHDISTELLSASLGLEVSQLGSFLSSSAEYYEISGDSVVLAASEQTQKNNKVEGNIRVEEIMRLLDTVRTTPKV